MSSPRPGPHSHGGVERAVPPCSTHRAERDDVAGRLRAVKVFVAREAVRVVASSKVSVTGAEVASRDDPAARHAVERTVEREAVAASSSTASEKGFTRVGAGAAGHQFQGLARIVW